MEGWFVPEDLQLFAPTTVGILVTGLAVVFLARKQVSDKSRKQSAAPKRKDPDTSPRSTSTEDDSNLDAYRRPNLHGTLIPSTGLLVANPAEPYEFDNQNCSGLFLPLHRPTLDPASDMSGAYKYSDHFAGRKRLWELRVQFRFKEDVKGSFLVGIELEKYVPLNAAAKRFMGMTVAALRQVAGNDLYHSVGDDPDEGAAPHEKPCFMMPLWACDQVVVTPEGEDPPDITHTDFSAYGSKRADDRKAFVQEIENMKLTVGPTYTFSFWGISQFLDVIKWEVTKIIPFRSFDFNQFCGRPPVHLVFYTLNDAATEDDKRHIQSRKNYYFRFALWSSQNRPSREKIRELIPCEGDLGHHRMAATPSVGQRGFLSRLFACCASERSA